MSKLTIGLLLLVVFAKAQTVFVATNGNDASTGTLVRPYKTLGKALQSVRQFPGKDVHIQLRGGTYYLNKPLVLNAENARFTALTIHPYKNETVVLSAGQRVKLDWKPIRNGIVVASLPATCLFERLFVNGKPQILARYPNYDSTARVFHGTAEDAISPDRVKTWKKPVGGYVHALHRGEWGGFHYRISGVDKAGNLQLEGGWQNNRPAAMHKQNRFVENILEELDAPGEWYLDKATHQLYYYPPKDVKINQALVEISGHKNCIELRGTAEKPIRHITLERLRFAHTERSFMDTREPLVRSDWTIYRGGAVLFSGTENCQIRDCQFTDLGGNAIFLSNYNRQDTISGCLIANIGAGAVSLVGDANAVRSPLFSYDAFQAYSQIDKHPGPLTSNYPQECVVTDNLIHNIGDVEKQVAGVQIEMASAITVSHNSIYNTPRSGINIGDGCWGGHVLAYNDVFNTVLETGDHGAFNSWGRDRYWAANRQYMDSLVQVHPELILLDAQKQTVIHDNRFRCDHGWDIDLDDGSSNYHIYNNLCLNGGLKLREGFYRVVENNVLINNSFHPHVWFKNSGDVFKQNIVTKKYAPIQIRDWGDNVDYNLFPDSSALSEAHKNGTDLHSGAGNAQFTNPRLGDFTLVANSPAFRIGFHNFPMTNFGVQKPTLKRMALTAPIPELLEETTSQNGSSVVPFLGGTIKSIVGLGERSAYGLPDATGVLIVSAAQNSVLTKSGLLEKDVIRVADGNPVKDVKALRDVLQSAGWKGVIPIEIFRNQQPVRLTLSTR